MEHAKNFYQSMSVNQAVGLGAMLTLLVGAVTYGPVMNAHDDRIVSTVRADLVPVRAYVDTQNQALRFDDQKITALEQTVHTLTDKLKGINAASAVPAGQK